LRRTSWLRRGGRRRIRCGHRRRLRSTGRVAQKTEKVGNDVVYHRSRIICRTWTRCGGSLQNPRSVKQSLACGDASPYSPQTCNYTSGIVDAYLSLFEEQQAQHTQQLQKCQKGYVLRQSDPPENRAKRVKKRVVGRILWKDWWCGAGYKWRCLTGLI
jgi:hypothetical protein